ncbi:host specificity protein J [Collimonas humicola]|uniref:host specificity protein J n=1 Tax=Collimonas humicola TaxID=2825886 RepID=UPI001B8CC6E3|nr:phage tail protein [Collimonas humicola]
MTEDVYISGAGGGGKGGGGSQAPVEAPDSLRSKQYAHILDLLSEGETFSLVDGAKSVYLDGTPLQNPDGTLNFQSVSLFWSTGTQSQGSKDISAAPVSFGTSDVRSETVVNVRIRNSTPIVRTITDGNVTYAVITLSVPSLEVRDMTNGNLSGTSVGIAIDVQTNGGGFVNRLNDTISGKTSSKYQRSYTVPLTGSAPWDIRVSRTTPDSTVTTLENDTWWDTYTSVIPTHLSYPNSTVVSMSIDSQQFQNIPARAYDIKGLVIRIPSNYDPIARTYTGLWDGTFKLAWSDNPAWCYFDLLTSARYGLGDYIDVSQVDKWGLYTIGQYCDGMVPSGLLNVDGSQKMEPRFTCNLYLQTQAEAFTVIQNFASIFRAIALWSASSMMVVQDAPANPIALFTNANVIDGNFGYVGSSIKSRHTTVQVSWNNPALQYRQDIEYVSDDAAVSLYGVKSAQIVAFGCTSRGQAHRIGQWLLYSEGNETEVVTFRASLEAAMLYPGAIINTSDINRSQTRMGGRINGIAGNVLTLDAPVNIVSGHTYSINIMLENGGVFSSAVNAATGSTNTLTLTASLPAQPVAGAIFILAADNLVPEIWRVVSMTEVEPNIVEIGAVQYDPNKFAKIEYGLQFDVAPIGVNHGISLQAPPTNVVISSNSYVEQGMANTIMTISWTPVAGAVAYIVAWRRNGASYVAAGRVGESSVDVNGIYAGTYVASVIAVNAGGSASLPAYSVETKLQGKTTPPPAITSLTTKSLTFGIEIDWTFPSGGAFDTQTTEIWYGKTPNIGDAVKLTDMAFPQSKYTMLGLAAGASLYFWGRLVDKSGNIGSYYPSGAGVNGQSSSDATDILTYLSGQINQTQLAKDLAAQIAIIPKLDNTMSQSSDALAATQIMSQITADTATATLRTDLGAQINGNTALIQSEQTARANADSALATSITNMQATVGANTAAIQQESTARASADSAQATLINTVQATANGAQAAASTNATVIANMNGQLSAMYTIKTQLTADGKTYIAGIGVGVDNSSGVTQSQVLVTADRFGVLNQIAGSGATTFTSPFVIQGGQTFINQALIGTGWITNAMIGNTIQSTAVNPTTGLPVWVLDKGGTFQMNGSTANGGRTTMNETTIIVYDDGNVPRVKLGKIS